MKKLMVFIIVSWMMFGINPDAYATEIDSFEYWRNHVPGPGISVPLDYSVIKSEGVNPIDLKMSYTVEVKDGYYYGGLELHTTDSKISICFGDIFVEDGVWSDGMKYFTSCAFIDCDTLEYDINRWTPPEYSDTVQYQSQMNYYGSYESLFNQRGRESISDEFNSTLMFDDDWYLVLAAYDSLGSRAGYTVVQIENTPELLNARAQYIIQVDNNTGIWIANIESAHISDDSANISVNGSVEQGSILAVATYNEDGKFLDIQMEEIDFFGNYQIKIDRESVSIVRIFLLNHDLCPICEKVEEFLTN